jgi:SAM-dependent methyltransferase
VRATTMAATPTLEGFEKIIEMLANDPRIAPDSPDWIRGNIASCGDKLRILRYVLNGASNGSGPRVLDVGAQIGAFALFAASLGCRTSAVDYGFYAKKYGKIAADHGVDYQQCDVGLQPLPFADNSFDFATYSDVIEHHSFSPKRVLREIHRVLAPGGRLIVTTPNHASIYNRALLLFGKTVNDSFEQYFDASADSDVYHGHHREYTRGELRAALERTGFKVRECRVVEESLGPLLYYSRRSRNRAPVSNRARNIVIRALGEIWEPLHLPFGREIWAVGEKERQ